MKHWIEEELTVENDVSFTIREGSTLLLDRLQLERNRCLTVTGGLLRVWASPLEEEAEEAQPVTLGFLKAGDHLPLDQLRRKRLHLQALSAAQLVESHQELAADGSSLHDWTLELLLIRNHSDAERRIMALMKLLVAQLGRRCGAWYELLLPLTHAELADLCGHNRVTVTRQFSRWRNRGLLEQDRSATRLLRLSPALLDGGADPRATGPIESCEPRFSRLS